MYERTDGKKSFVVAINPSASAVEVALYGKEVLSQNCKVGEKSVTLLGKSFIIMEK